MAIDSNAEDSFLHYNHCIPLWSAISDRMLSFRFSGQPEILPGLRGTTRTQLLGVAWGFHVFHVFKGVEHVPAAQLENAVQAEHYLRVEPQLKGTSHSGVQLGIENDQLVPPGDQPGPQILRKWIPKHPR